MEFDFKDLEIFCRIVELKSFTKAAKKVFLAQASVSERMSNLEEQVGIRLLDRIPKGVELTSAGRLFYGYAKEILRLKTELVRELKDFVGIKAGTLEVGGSTVPGEYILPSMIRGFVEKYPLVEISLLISDSMDIRERVVSGLLELGVVGAVDEGVSLEYIPMWKDELVLAVAKGHALFGREEATVKEVLKETFVLRERGSGTLSFWERSLKAAGIDPERDLRVVARLGSTTSVKEAVKSGLGVSIISRRAILKEVEAGDLWATKVQGLKLIRSFYLICDKRRTLSPIARAFKAYLLEFKEDIENI